MSALYLGRIVAIGRSQAGRLAAMYRVSSRSFPNRQATMAAGEKRVSIGPKPGHEGDIYKNPYIAYNCAKVVGRTAIVTNGSHTDPVAEKIQSGMTIRDALIYALAALDYEKDDYHTPRIAAVVRQGEECGWLGSVRADGLDVRAFKLEPGTCYHLSTYEHAVPSPHHRSELVAADAEGACDFILSGGVFAGFTNPVTAVCWFETEDGFTGAVKDAESA